MPDHAAHDSSFAQATAVKSLSSHTYSATFLGDWCIGTVPHGGYVTSVFMRVATAHFKTTLAAQKQPNTICLHLDFVRRTHVGPALFHVRHVKIGRQTSTISITLSQGAQDLVVAMLTNTDIAAETGLGFPTAWQLEPRPLPVALERLASGSEENWSRKAEMPYTGFRKAMAKVRFYFPTEGQKQRSVADEWVRLSTGEKWTNESLGFLSDTWPSVVESLYHEENPYDIKTSGQGFQKRSAAFWFPTLVLNLDVKKSLPEEGVEWLFVRAYAKQIKNGRFDLEVIICDAAGEIVALSHHSCLILSAARNTTRSESKI